MTGKGFRRVLLIVIVKWMPPVQDFSPPSRVEERKGRGVRNERLSVVPFVGYFSIL